MVGDLSRTTVLRLVCSGALIAALWATATATAQPAPGPKFVTSDRCIACHSNMVAADGETLSIGHTWRASMMALSAKDPYWQAAVRREIADHPGMQHEIEDVCSVCHMPMFRTTAVANGRAGELVRYFSGAFSPREQALATDGVSCTACHQISEENFGQHASFSGGYAISPSLPNQAQAYGPYEVSAGHQRIMHSASALVPAKATHVQRSELCATCHTLFTPAMDGEGEIIGDFPEQVPYLEWKHSAYREAKSCQDCHMPEVEVPVPISSVLGGPRENVSRHVFRGGNVFMMRLLDTYRDELGVTTPAADLEEAARQTLEHLQSAAAEVAVANVEISESEAVIDVRVTNRTGHKLPTAYPSRRAWLHVTVRDPGGGTIFESGAPEADGSIAGNDNDADPRAYEPHHGEISRPDQVQIYEPVMRDHDDEVTTSLLSGVAYAKDNRLLPLGFDKGTAGEAVAVRGAAADDGDFGAAGDSVRYRVALPEGVGGVQVSVRLLYQTIGYRWAQNLQAYDSHETNRFVGYYRAEAETSTVVLAEAAAEAASERSPEPPDASATDAK